MSFRKIPVSVVFLCISTAALSQVDLKSKYEKEVIYLSGRYYFKNNERYSIKNLSSEFQNSPEALDELSTARLDARKSRGYLLIGALAYFSGAIVLSHNQEVGIGLVAGSVVPSLVSIHFTARASRKFKKALWLRNRDVLIE